MRTKPVKAEEPMTTLKPFDFDALFSSQAAEDEGIDVDIRREDNNEPSGFVIRVAGPNSARNTDVVNRIIERRRAMPANAKLTVTDLRIDNIEQLVSSTISWTYPEGFDGPPCTPENARQLYAERNGIRLQIEAVALSTKSFIRP